MDKNTIAENKLWHRNPVKVKQERSRRAAVIFKWALGYVQVHPYDIKRQAETIRRQEEEIKALEFRIKTLER